MVNLSSGERSRANIALLYIHMRTVKQIFLNYLRIIAIINSPWFRLGAKNELSLTALMI